MSVFPTPTNVNEHVYLALDSDHTSRDDVEISQGRGQLVCSYWFICVKPHKTNVQRMLYSML